MSIFGKIAKFFGRITVKVQGNQVKVTGIDAGIMKSDIRRLWQTDIINKMMFTTTTETSFTFHEFFIPDILFILSKMSTDPSCKWASKQTIDRIIEGLVNNTWYKMTLDEVIPITDKKRMNLLKWKPMPKQLEFLHLYGDKIPRFDLRGYILALAPGLGKAQPLTSHIHTPGGWITMGEVLLDTLVTMPDGSSASVTGIYPQGLKDIFKVTFKDGRSTECCEEHLWDVQYDNLSDEWVTRNTKEIMEYLDKGISVKVPTPLKSLWEHDYDSLLPYIDSIEYVGVKEAQCISVDHPDHRYITDDYIVTHNTFTDLLVATCIVPPSIAEVKIIVSPKKAVHLVWEKSVRQVFKKIPKYWCSDFPSKMPVGDKTEYYIFNFEQLDKAIELGEQLTVRGIRYLTIVDESHNFADDRSLRTQKLVRLQTINPENYFIWTSGSPILKTGTELISFLKCADPRFDVDAERRFRRIFAAAPGRANEIFNHRLGNMMAFIVPKSDESKANLKVKELPVKLPRALAHNFLMSTVKQDMKDFIVERLKVYEGQMKDLKAHVNKWLDYHSRQLTTKAQKKAFSEYLVNIKILTKNPDKMIPEVLNAAKAYERTRLLPSLPPTERKGFRNALSAVKNIKLKVRGEALGKILSKRRSECAAALAYYCKPEEIMKESLSKTLFFASSVLPIELLGKHLRDMGFNPVLVYGGTNKNLTKMMEDFDKDPSLNPACATMQSLSEAVPVTAASTVVLLNRPFRQATWDQVVSRADRLGQKYPVTVIEVTLDTGNEPNVSSTTDDILNDVRDLINDIVGESFAGPDPDEREYKELVDASQEDPILLRTDDLMGL